MEAIRSLDSLLASEDAARFLVGVLALLLVLAACGFLKADGDSV